MQLKAEQKALQELYQEKGKYTNAGSNQSALFQKGESNTLDFDPSKPLNIERYKYKSEGEKLYEEEVEKHKNHIGARLT